MVGTDQDLRPGGLRNDNRLAESEDRACRHQCGPHASGSGWKNSRDRELFN